MSWLFANDPSPTPRRARINATMALALLFGCTPAPSKPHGTGAAAATPATTTQADPPRSATSAAPPTAPAAPGKHRYRIAMDDLLTTVKVELCFDGAVPEYVVAPTDTAQPLIRNATLAAKPLTADKRGLPLANARRGDCLRYEVDLTAAFAAAGRDARRFGRSAVLSPDAWLWMPEPRPTGTVAVATFDLPPGWKAGVAWPRNGSGYRIPETTFVWKAQAAFGPMDQHTLRSGGATIEVFFLGGRWGDQKEVVLDWLRTSAASITSLFGRFPVDRAQLLVVPRGSRGTFGMAVQGGGPSAVIELPNSVDAAMLADDWTAVHELLHFSLPPIVTRDAWLHEGITTYLTTLARARAGLISERFGWWELLDGFKRGKQVGTGKKLRDESASMHETHSYWRVYWAGAAMALAMDVELHKRGLSLEQTVLDLSKQKLELEHRWTGEEVVARLDQSCGSKIPSDEARRHLDSSEFPDTAALAASLGIALKNGRTSKLDDAAPDAAIRKAIMRRSTTK